MEGDLHKMENGNVVKGDEQGDLHKILQWKPTNTQPPTADHCKKMNGLNLEASNFEASKIGRRPGEPKDYWQKMDDYVNDANGLQQLRLLWNGSKTSATTRDPGNKA